MQAEDGYQSQKRVGPFLGIWASVDDLAGQYGRTAVPRQSKRQPSQPRRGCRILRPRGAGLSWSRFRKVRLGGDTDFSQTTQLDRWDDDQVAFVFGLDAIPNLYELAENLPENA